MGQLMSYSVEPLPPVASVADKEAAPKFESPFTLRNALLCIPSFSMITSLIFINVVSVPFYASIGVKAELLLLFVAISRAFDAVVDPFVAHWYEWIRPDYANENTVRYQTCLAGGVMSALTIGLHLSPPTSIQSDGGLLAWFALTYLLYTVSFSFVAIPITALQWQAFPYLGARDQYKRTTLALCCEIVQNIGLAIVFLMSGYSSTNKASELDDKSVYDSCYTTSGVGQSCLAHPDTGKKLQYNIFDPDMWASSTSTGWSDYECRTVYGEIQSDPAVLYNPASCVLHSEISYAPSCIATYCACVAECSNLHNLALRESSVSGAGWLVFTTFLIAALALPVYIYGWESIFKSPRARKRGISTDGNATETAKPSAQPLEPLVPKLINLFRNKVVRSFLLPWLLDSIAYMTVLGTMSYYIRGVIKPEYAELPVDCNQAIAIFGEISDSWRCEHRAVTSLLLALIMFSAVLAAFVWYYLSRVVGSVRAWQLGSLMSFLSILALVFSADRDAVSKALGLGLLIGVGMGSRFLSDCVVVDVIHYYEFISGYQYQHLFAMFKILFLKLSVISMHMLPLAVYFDVDFNPVLPQYQNTPLESGVESSLCQFFTIAVPSVLFVTSFVLKMHFRLVDDEQFDLTAEGIRVLYNKHNANLGSGTATPNASDSDKGLKAAANSKTAPPSTTKAPAEFSVISAIDPTSGIHYPAENLTYKEMQGAMVFAHFLDTQCTIDFHSCAHSQSPYIGVDLLINRRRDAAAICFFIIIALAVGLVFASEGLYTESGLLFVPLMMIIAMGWVAFAGYCAGKSLQTAILLKDPQHQPAVETLDKVIRNLDTLEDIALVNLPTREVLRRYHAMRDEGADLSTHSANAAGTAQGNASAKTQKDNKVHEMDPRTSKEMRDLIAAEALKATIPTKEMEVMEWEQALFRAAKRSLARAKVPTPRTLKLVKTLQRSSRLQAGNREPALTRWEAEFYSYIASQHRRNSRIAKYGSADAESDEDSISTASVDSTEESDQARGGGEARRGRAQSVRSSLPTVPAAATSAPAPVSLPVPHSTSQDSVTPTYFDGIGSYSDEEREEKNSDDKDEGSSHFSISSEDLDNSQHAPPVVPVVPPQVMPVPQVSVTSHFDLGDEDEDQGDSGSGSGGDSGDDDGSGSDGGGSGSDGDGSGSGDSADEINSENSFGASNKTASKPQSASGSNRVHAAVIRAGSASGTSRPGMSRQQSDTVGFEEEFPDDADVEYSLPEDSEGDATVDVGFGESDMPSPPSSAGSAVGRSGMTSRAISGLPAGSLLGGSGSGVASPAPPSSAGKPPLAPNSGDLPAPVAEAAQTRSRSFSTPQSIDLGDPTQQPVLQFDTPVTPVLSGDSNKQDTRDRLESIALSIDIRQESDDMDELSSMSDGEAPVRVGEATAGVRKGVPELSKTEAQASSETANQPQQGPLQSGADDAVSVDYSLPSDD